MLCECCELNEGEITVVDDGEDAIPLCDECKAALNPTALCGRCGKIAEGFATINGVRYCHPDDESLPDCYSLGPLRAGV